MKICAEIGSNWKTPEDCLKSIEVAKTCGAHAVKFQLFTPFDLYGDTGNFTTGTPYMPSEWLPVLKNHAIKHEIEFMCTAFSPNGYTLVNQHVSTHKIASAELTDTNILNRVNSYEKPVYLSTAGSDIYSEVKNALLYLKKCPVTIMFCVADYPAKIVDFRHLSRLKEVFGANYSYGYSDHTIDVNNIPLIAKMRGASVIEKHVNLANVRDTPDAPHSISEDEFKLMCRLLMDEPVTEEEMARQCNQQMISTHKRRFIATKNIPIGGEFKIGYNVEIYRSKKASSSPVLTFRPWDLKGMHANKDKIVGDTISYQDIDTDVL